MLLDPVVVTCEAGMKMTGNIMLGNINMVGIT